MGIEYKLIMHIISILFHPYTHSLLYSSPEDLMVYLWDHVRNEINELICDDWLLFNYVTISYKDIVVKKLKDFEQMVKKMHESLEKYLIESSP